ncbi:FabD/lysophospholipase-like protein [Xylariomycetidae sp. FL0641]|nr:FabD/lysophospholipase-like protein [Xylariomycetidae sp. FL0641]
MADDLTTPRPCQTCGTTDDKTFTCIQCNNLAFCDGCWPKWVLHLPGAVGWNGKPHEKSDPMVVRRLRQILEPKRSEHEHENELLEDCDTTWFGFGRDAMGHPLLHDHGRFAAIMAETQTNETRERHPMLASFIGETGAGKSTLIKLLIDRQDEGSADGSKYYSPVTSSNQDRISTTGDVHLYADPATLYSNEPLLLVDCEGLSGGEAMPKQLKSQTQLMRSAGVLGPRPRRHSSPRKIEWAETPQTQKREFAVAQLYPRILYTFSDVVIFVLRNPRAFESTVLHQLIRWGAASIDKSINQPVLPHAVIVLNATDVNVDEKEWDVDQATEMLLSDIHGAIFREPVLKEYVETWRKRGRILSSTQELLECYYASISVVRVPYKGSYMLMNEQAGKLTDLVKNRCAASHAKKRQMRMLATSEKLEFYLQAAYDHFTKDLNSPFDFVQETLRHSPISRNFEGNILSLALSIRDYSIHSHLRADAEQIFRAIGPVIASCVMLDAVRQKLPGTVGRLLDDRYAGACAGAMQTFADLYWPCNFVNPSIFGELGQCCNVRSGHNEKGHQNKEGKIIGHGGYQSNFDASEFQPLWDQLIRQSLMQVQSASFRLTHEFPDRNELQVASLLHQERLNELYSNILGDAKSFISYSACLCCLRELPECALPCGHVLCLPCVEMYGNRTSKTTIEINRCPLHVRDIIATPPWVVTTKPRFAGTRILSLDGGGVRSVIQLQVLQEIERILGPNLPIQLFFDLIVGTNSGGFAAIGLGVKKWTVEATIEKFKEFSRQAFTKRELGTLPVLSSISTMYHGSVYRTQPLETALQTYFSNQPFFGGAVHRSTLTTSNKVAITTTTAMDKKVVAFANYNRPDPVDKTLPYQFVRADSPAKEMRMWEAARATSACAPYFKPYAKPETKREYVNSDLRYMCPVATAHHEAKAIWGDVANAPPDLLLSIGTGRNIGDRPLDDLPGPRSVRANSFGTSLSSPSLSNPGPSAVLRQGRGGSGNYKRHGNSPSIASFDSGYRSASGSSSYLVRNPQAPLLMSFQNPITGLADRLNKPRACEHVWYQFVRGRDVSKNERERYVRVCPELLSRLPKFDEVGRMEEIEQEARNVVRGMTPELSEIAHRLVASSFFFEKDAGSVREIESGFTCTGSIFCRFRPHSPEIKALAGFLISLLAEDFTPYFMLEQSHADRASWPVRHISLAGSVLQDMQVQGEFHMDPIRVHAASEEADVQLSICLQAAPYPSGASILPISGFPRKLMTEDEGASKHAAPRTPSLQSTVSRPTSSAESADISSGRNTPTRRAPPVRARILRTQFSYESFSKLSLGLRDSEFSVAELEN